PGELLPHRRGRAADQLGPVLGHLVGEQLTAAVPLSEQGTEESGLAARAGAEVEPGAVAAGHRSRGRDQGDQLAALVLDPGTSLPYCRDGVRVTGAEHLRGRGPAAWFGAVDLVRLHQPWPE